MVRWHHRLNGHESEQTPGDNGRQRSLGYCSTWGHKELDMTEQLTDYCSKWKFNFLKFFHEGRKE